MDQLFHAVAIDGPSGAGKSTLARRVARELHFLYVDTGAIYRSIGWYVLQRGAALDNAELVAALLPDLNVEVRYGEDVAADPFIAAVKRLAINERLDLDTAKLLIAEYKKTRTPEHTPGRDK